MPRLGVGVRGRLFDHPGVALFVAASGGNANLFSIIDRCDAVVRSDYRRPDAEERTDEEGQIFHSLGILLREQAVEKKTNSDEEYAGEAEPRHSSTIAISVLVDFFFHRRTQKRMRETKNGSQNHRPFG